MSNKTDGKTVFRNRGNEKIITSIYRCVSAKQNGEWMVGIISRNTIAIVFSDFCRETFFDLIN
jgi:hypothetical protein